MTKLMTFEDAVKTARKITEAHPQLILTGSVALIMCGRIPCRDVSDLDFCCGELEVPEGLKVSKDSRDPHDYLMGVPVNIFTHVAMKKGPYLEGLQLWDLEDIERYKREYDRPKDRRDLGSTRRGPYAAVSF